MFTASVPQWRRDALVPPPHPPEWSLPLPASAPSIQDRRRPRVRGALSGAYHRGRGEPGAGLDPLQGTSVGPGGHPTLSEARALEGRHLCQRAWGAPPREAACLLFHSLLPIHSFTHSHSFSARRWSCPGGGSARCMATGAPRSTLVRHRPGRPASRRSCCFLRSRVAIFVSANRVIFTRRRYKRNK